MKRSIIWAALILCLLCVLSAAAQNEAGTLVLLEKDVRMPVSRMFWDQNGKVLTLVSPDSVIYIPTADEAAPKDIEKAQKGSQFADAGSGKAAALSADKKTIMVYSPGSDTKDVLSIEPGFTALSVSLSEDGTLVLADSADEIRTVVYASKNGETVYDLEGFQTAAPVYDSTLSRDGKYVLWHARGTFALQNAADGKFYETISLWDFASSFDLSPDSKVLAVGIIDEDYEKGAVIFFNARTGNELGRTLLENTPYELSFSADGSALYAADGGTLCRINTKTYEVTGQYELAFPEASENDRISRIAAAPDGKSAAVLLSTGDLVLVD